MTTAMLSKGPIEPTAPVPAPPMTEAHISNAFADIAAQQGGDVGHDRASVTLRTLSSERQRQKAVALLGRMLVQPGLPQDLLKRAKARAISAVKEELTKPEAIAERAFWRLLYAPHPYGTNATVASVRAILRQDVVDFHRGHYARTAP